MDKRKLVLFIAQSLDGYIASKEESLDWLFQVEGEGDNGYSEFYETVYTILMGKRTYDWIIQQEKGEFPYPAKESFVFSRTVKEDLPHITIVNDDVVRFTNQLKQKEGKDIWLVGGGDLLHTFLKEDLVDELIVTVAPVLLGSGVPLFKERGNSLDLHLKGTRRFNQFVELHYEVR
ncbi:dihydrofolate reductase family protein [Halobacillus rhizosphaerae]